MTNEEKDKILKKISDIQNQRDEIGSYGLGWRNACDEIYALIKHDYALIESEEEAPPEEKKRRVYLSGPITGDPNYRERFAATESSVTECGYEVINPVKVADALPELRYAEYMTIDEALIAAADIVYMLEGWEASEGANKEMKIAMEKNKEIVFQPKNHQAWKPYNSRGDFDSQITGYAAYKHYVEEAACNSGAKTESVSGKHISWGPYKSGDASLSSLKKIKGRMNNYKPEEES